MWDHGGRNIKLDQAKFTYVEPQSRGPQFNFAAQGVSLFDWLVKHGSKNMTHCE